MLKLLFFISLFMFVISIVLNCQENEYQEALNGAISSYRSGDYQKAGEAFDKAFSSGKPMTIAAAMAVKANGRWKNFPGRIQNLPVRIISNWMKLLEAAHR